MLAHMPLYGFFTSTAVPKPSSKSCTTPSDVVWGKTSKSHSIFILCPPRRLRYQAYPAVTSVTFNDKVISRT